MMDINHGWMSFFSFDTQEKDAFSLFFFHCECGIWCLLDMHAPYLVNTQGWNKYKARVQPRFYLSSLFSCEIWRLAVKISAHFQI